MALGLGVLCGCGGGSSVKVLYAVGLGSPNVSIFQVSGSGALSTPPNSVSTGEAPDVIGIDPMARFAYILDSACSALDRSTCGNQGRVSQYVLSSSTGNLTVATFSSTNGLPATAQTGVNPSAMVIDSTGTFVFVANRGSNPQNPPSLSVFTIDPAGGTLTEVKQLQPPACPNQFSICPLPIAVLPSALATTGKMLFVANAGAGMVSMYPFNSAGALDATRVVTTMTGGSPSLLAMDSSGKFLFVADPVANTAAVFRVESSGHLTAVGMGNTGTTPVSVRVHPTGKFLYTANQVSNDVSVFSIDSSGALKAPSVSPVAPGIGPSYVTTDTSGGFLFVANRDSHDISVFSIDSSGALKQVTGSPFDSVVTNPVALASIN